MSAQRICASALGLACASLLLQSCGGPHAPQPANAPAPPGVRYEAHIAAGGAPPSGAMLSNTMTGNAAAAKTGAALFTAMNCEGCHGIEGAGWVGPSLSDGRWRYGGSDAEIFSSIYYGRPKGMPAFGGVLSPDGIWQLVSYLKALPVPPREATESWETGP